MSSILDETQDLLPVYLYHAGDSPVPLDFHTWACISMVSAALADRVSVEIYRGSPLFPNLYVFLIGPSGTGKGVAIDTAMKFIRDNPRVNVFAATKVTSEALTQHLAQRVRKNEKANIYLNTPEMALSVGRGERADNFIRAMTELFTGRAYKMTESTVTRGDNALSGYCLNWVAGTTEEWLHGSVRKDDIAGGFFARVLPIRSSKAGGLRKTFPVYPPDYDELVGWIQQRVEEISYLEGVFDFTTEARETFEVWNEERPISNDPLLAPSHERRGELVLKVAMSLAVMDSSNLQIRKHHILNATQLVGGAMKALPSIIDKSSETADTAGMFVLSDFLQATKQIRHAALIRYAMKRGIAPKRLSELLGGLQQANMVRRVNGPGGLIYVWTGRRKMPVDKKADEQAN